MNEIADGEIHAISDDYAYILQYVRPNDIIQNSDDLKRLFLKKYIKYLIDNKNENVIEILVDYFYMQGNDDFTFFYRPPWVGSCLSQKGSYVLRFKRIPNDNLESENDS